MNSSFLPSSIQQFIGNNPLYKNKIGQSPSDVYSFTKNNELFYLKSSEPVFADTTYSVLREAKVLEWVNPKINVPELVLMEENQQSQYMITKAISARPIVDLDISAETVISIYTEALKQLQAIPIQNCPFISNLDYRLKEAKYLLDHHLIEEVDWDDVDMNVWGNYKTHAELYNDLIENKQKIIEDLIFSHGDITDTNIFLDNKDEIIFLDVGRAGIADRFVDITFIERCLREDCSPQDAQTFLKHLPQDNPFKRDYFLKLDELN